MSIQIFDSSGGHFAVFVSPRVTVAVHITIAILARRLAVGITFGNSYNVWERVSRRARELMRIHGEISGQICMGNSTPAGDSGSPLARSESLPDINMIDKKMPGILHQ